MTALRRTIQAETRVISRSEGLVEYIASDESVDSHKEVIRAAGWRFTNFKKNAPFVDSHDYGSIDRLLGRVVDFRVAKGRLVETVEWAKNVAENVRAQIGWKMTEAGFLKAVSVGFYPVRKLTPADGLPFQDELRALGIKSGADVRTIYLEQEQLELSAVVIGSNTNALARAYKAGALSDEDIDNFTALKTGQPVRRSVAVNIPFPEVNGPVRATTSPSSMPTPSRTEFLRQFERLTGATKKSYERLTRARDVGADSDELARLLRDTSHQMALERRLARGNPAQRILADPLLRAYLNAKIRQTFLRGPNGQPIFAAALNDEHRSILKALGEDSGAGSTLITGALAPELYDLLLQYGAALSTLGVVSIGSKTGNFPVLTARPNAVFLTEGATMADDASPAGTSVSGDAQHIGCLLHISEQLLEDADVDLAEPFLAQFEEAINMRIDTACFNGNGVADSSNGGITGIFQDAGVTVITAAAGNPSVQTLDEDDFINTIAAVDAAALQRDPRFWIAPALFPQMMKIRDGSGQPLLKTPVETGVPGEFAICGYPVTLTAGAPSTNAASAKVAVFGHGRGYGVGVRDEFHLEASKHHRWAQRQRSFRAIMRVTGKMRKTSAFAILRTAAA